jgi:hypothetical protein
MKMRLPWTEGVTPFSWHERMARNARLAPAPRLEITIYELPASLNSYFNLLILLYLPIDAACRQSLQ